MNRTEHIVRQCFDSEYSAKYDELLEERRIIVKDLVSYFTTRHFSLWFALLAFFLAFMSTGDFSFLSILICSTAMLIIPVAEALMKYTAKKRSLGL